MNSIGRNRVGVFAALALATGVATVVAAGPMEDGNAGLDALSSGDNDTAIKMFTRALASPALSADDQALAYTERGLAYLRKHQFSAAKIDLQRALALRPGAQNARTYLGLANQGRSDDAATAAPAAAPPTAGSPAADPAPAPARTPSAARALFSGIGRALAEGAKQGLCQGLIGTNCPDQQQASAGAAEGTSAPAAPSPPRPHTPSMDDGAKGLAALDRGQYELAIRYFNRAIKANDLVPEDAELAYFSRAKAYYKLGAEQQALSDLSQAMRLAPTDADAQAAFAQVVSGHRRGPSQDPPVDAGTCAAHFKSTGSFVSGRMYTVWVTYAHLNTLDAFVDAFNLALANNWTITKADFDYGTIEATQAIPGSPRTLTISMKEEPMDQGSRITITVQVPALLIVPDAKATVCRTLGGLSP